jgi:hypothetical protein
VACDPRTGIAYLVDLRSAILRFTPEGGRLPPVPIAALAVAIGEMSGQIWATTKFEVLRLDQSGAALSRSPLGSDSGQSWLSAR